MADTDSESKTKNDVYRERNLLALLTIRTYIGFTRYAGFDLEYGWWPDADDVNGEEWAVVWMDSLEGQVGWHIPKEMVPDWLPKQDPQYDGYSTATKNGRVATLAGLDQHDGN